MPYFRNILNLLEKCSINKDYKIILIIIIIIVIIITTH